MRYQSSSGFKGATQCGRTSTRTAVRMANGQRLHSSCFQGIVSEAKAAKPRPTGTGCGPLSTFPHCSRQQAAPGGTSAGAIQVGGLLIIDSSIQPAAVYRASVQVGGLLLIKCLQRVGFSPEHGRQEARRKGRRQKAVREWGGDHFLSS
jgi:hypothetical protein